MSGFLETPGRFFLLAAALPLLVAALLALTGLWHRAVGRLVRPREWMRSLPAVVAIVAMLGSTALSIHGLRVLLAEPEPANAAARSALEQRWGERVDWVRLGGAPEDRAAVAIRFGYRVDALSGSLMAMVCLISACVFLFSWGYLREETRETLEDHTLHLRRPGRQGVFYLYLSLFAFAMLALLLADNLLQIFIGWELVGVCSFFLIGFYSERPPAARAAVKAFVMNRVGDAGFLVGLAIVWSSFGTFELREIGRQLRCPERDSHAAAAPVDLADTIVRGDRQADQPDQVRLSPGGSQVILFPEHWHHQDLRAGVVDSPMQELDPYEHYRLIPYGLLVVAGLGIFLGCVGKSAQFPLHTWLPDAMEGPTPVSALIHAATMVAAGVYLAARAFPLFTPEVLQCIAWLGLITLVLGAGMALVMTDIKKVLAYSTVSQLGYMMLALGLGGWRAAVLHLLTHAFFKALLFLSAGSVIHGCHHEQDLRRMGGLWRRMPFTAAAMLVGVLAIIGTPLLSGWYSKDLILGQAQGYAQLHPSQPWWFWVPLGTAALTGFYMLRLWLLAFAGTPRDPDVHAHESSWVMKLPLAVLAAGALAIAWGNPPTEIEASAALRILAQAEPSAVATDWGDVDHARHEAHSTTGILALAAAGLGVLAAIYCYTGKRLRARAQAGDPRGVTRLLASGFHLDALYRMLFVTPVQRLGRAIARLDRQSPRESDLQLAPSSLDGLFNLLGQLSHRLGVRLHRVQTGWLRGYLLVLALTLVALFAILCTFAG